MFKSIVILILSAWITCSSAQELEKYEPPDGRIIHGLGQYVSFFYTDEENWQYVKEYENAVNSIPLIYSVYSALDPLLNTLDQHDYTEFVSGHEYPYLLNIGLILIDSTYLFDGKHIPVNSILSGELDLEIINIAQRIKEFGQPVFFRQVLSLGREIADFIAIWK